MKLELATFEKNNLPEHIQLECTLSDFIKAYQLIFIKEDLSYSSFTIYFNYLIDVYTNEQGKSMNVSFDIIRPSKETGEFFDCFFSKRDKYVKHRKLKIMVDNDEMELKKVSSITLTGSIEDVLKNFKEIIISDRYKAIELFKSLNITYDGEPSYDISDDYIQSDFEKFSKFIDNTIISVLPVAFKNELIEYDASQLSSTLTKNKDTVKRKKI